MAGGERPIRAIIVDDEELARRLLREYLGAHEDIEVIGECSNGFEAVKMADETHPDLLFLDIQMPKLDGFEVLELIDRGTAVIFVTAHDEHALRAFDVNAVDYLLKPLSPERLTEALERARLRVARREGPPVERLLAEARGSERPIERILVRHESRVHVILIGALDYIEAQDDYIGLRSQGKSYLKQQTLGDIEGLLDPDRFVRIHRSYILNIDRLAKLELYAKDSRVAILMDGTRLPVSRAGYTRLKELIS